MKKTIKISAIILAAFVLFGTLGVIAYNNATANDEIIAAAVISQGSRGETVKTIQTKLKRWGYYKGSVDGIYGAKTKEAVKYFQRKNGLKVDGIVGDKTLQALGINPATVNGGGNKGGGNNTKYSDSDIQLLARLIHGEARGESYTGRIAVGAVVMNRVKSSAFPNTISGVIYQPYAFTAVSDGQINLTPDSQSIKAAKEAMNGYDPTYGAIYYYNPATATSSWIYSRKTTVVIGRHVFAV